MNKYKKEDETKVKKQEAMKKETKEEPTLKKEKDRAKKSTKKLEDTAAATRSVIEGEIKTKATEVKMKKDDARKTT